ncbi:MAG: hypothetical protein V3V20_05140 [Algisphaera sp.]
MASPLHLLRTALRGMIGLSKATLDLEPVDEETRQHRRRICAACPAATRTKRLGIMPLSVLTPTSTCSVCRCNLHAKIKLASEQCPRHLWP